MSIEEQYLLKDEKNKIVTINANFWNIQKIGISPVCIVAVIKPKFINIENEIGHKNELYKILRVISNRAAEHSLMRPMVGFIDIDGITKELKDQFLKWTFDQEWHKGDFILYLFEDSNDSTLKPDELLSYSITPLEKIIYKKNTREFYEEHKYRAGSHYEDELSNLIDGVINTEIGTDNFDPDQNIKEFKEFEKEILDSADEIGG